MDRVGVSTSSTEMQSDSSPPSQKRQRAKQACEPCRLRKRRCDGSMPCNMCTQFEYKCFFEKHSRKRSKLVDHANAELTSPVKIESPVEVRQGVEESSKMRSMEANSGIAFTRFLGQRLDPSSGPKLFTFGWNLGIGYTESTPVGTPITALLNQDQMTILAQRYFEWLHPVYGFLDKDWVLTGINMRWKSGQMCSVPDHIFCGVAAIGLLFSTGEMTPLLRNLAESQRRALENSSIMRPPCMKDVQSWILQSIFLRAADHPHASWMASCTMMHLIESIGLQEEANTSILHPAVSDSHDDPEIRRRTFWVARMINSWISFEYGRNRVAIRGITASFPTSEEGDFTTEYLNLYSISCCLDPEQADKSPQWEEFLAQVEAHEASHPAIMLTKANLALCGYRRLRIACPNLSPRAMERIISLGLQGLAAAREMAEKKLCWWHVSNVPFQVICVFLAMDTKEALCHLGTAMRTLEFVVAQFGTVAIKEVLKTARFLVRLSKKRKDEDSQTLAMTLDKDSTDGADARPIIPNHNAAAPLPQLNTAAANFPINYGQNGTALGSGGIASNNSSEDWNLDILSNPNFDWNFCEFEFHIFDVVKQAGGLLICFLVLTAEMPALHGVAPDGTM
jgi:hypothetical protein